MHNQLELGAKIKEERLQLGDTLDKFAEKIMISRQTLAKWENGLGNGPTVNDLLRMCKLFHCDFGYLVGEYSCKRREASDIQAETGLSEEAIKQLQHQKAIIEGKQLPLPFEEAEESTTFLKMLSMLISHPQFIDFVCGLSKCGKLHNSGTSGVITMGDGKNVWAWDVAAILEKDGWSIISNIHAADYWLYSSLDTLRGIAKDIWEEPWKYGENLDK